MSRIGQRPIPIPAGVQAQVAGNVVTVKGPKGELRRQVHGELSVKLENNQLLVQRPSDDKRFRALQGTTRSVLRNMVDGVARGFQKILEIQGVGYKAEPQSSGVKLIVGFSHPVEYQAPSGIKISVDSNTLVRVEGPDKELVGQVAAEIRKIRPPEPYKGKGIRYQGEHVRRKAGKTGATAKA